MVTDDMQPPYRPGVDAADSAAASLDFAWLWLTGVAWGLGRICSTMGRSTVQDRWSVVRWR